MDFFQQLAALNIQGTLNLTIKTTSPGVMAVALMVKPNVNDPAVQAIPPLMLTGGAAQLDEGFFEKITQPLQDTGKLVTNIASYEKGLADAKAKSAAATAEKSENKKAYDEKMVLVETAAASQNYTEALKLLPDPKDFPDQASLIEKRKKDLRDLLGKASAPMLELA